MWVRGWRRCVGRWRWCRTQCLQARGQAGRCGQAAGAASCSPALLPCPGLPTGQRPPPAQVVPQMSTTSPLPLAPAQFPHTQPTRPTLRVHLSGPPAPAPCPPFSRLYRHHGTAFLHAPEHLCSASSHFANPHLCHPSSPFLPPLPPCSHPDGHHGAGGQGGGGARPPAPRPARHRALQLAAVGALPVHQLPLRAAAAAGGWLGWVGERVGGWARGWGGWLVMGWWGWGGRICAQVADRVQNCLSWCRAAAPCLPAVAHSCCACWLACCACCAGLQVLMSNMVALIWNTYMSYKSHA